MDIETAKRHFNIKLKDTYPKYKLYGEGLSIECSKFMGKFLIDKGGDGWVTKYSLKGMVLADAAHESMFVSFDKCLGKLFDVLSDSASDARWLIGKEWGIEDNHSFGRDLFDKLIEIFKLEPTDEPFTYNPLNGAFNFYLQLSPSLPFLSVHSNSIYSEIVFRLDYGDIITCVNRNDFTLDKSIDIVRKMITTYHQRLQEKQDNIMKQSQILLGALENIVEYQKTKVSE